MLEHIVKKIEQIEEVQGIYVVTNEKFYPHFLRWQKDFCSKKSISIINDGTTTNEGRLGAIGDILFVIEKESVEDELLVVAGDNLFEFSLLDVYSLYEEKKADVLALYDVGDKELACQYGIVEVDEEGRVKEFVEKPKEPPSTLASTGVYIFCKETLSLMKEYVKEGNNPDKTGHFIQWLYKRRPIYCYISKERWFDIGSFSQLEEARSYFSRR